ncbi:MAG: ribonuclease PH [Planctomycetes bacterium]|nr:ribonuclease PH [Planctomycetota bacterium]
MRSYNRTNEELRPIEIKRDFIEFPEGSVLITWGRTKILCTATVENKIPPHRIGIGGWLTAEYTMLPGSTQTRKPRKTGGREQEIQRLIGRSLRQAINLEELGDRTIYIDCDVIQADGGTRTAAITGAYVALHDAVKKLFSMGELNKMPLKPYLISAVSAGIVNNEVLLDLDYNEDSAAQADFNVVMTYRGDIIEIQGTAETAPLKENQFQEILKVAKKGILEICRIQTNVLNDSEGATNGKKI